MAKRLCLVDMKNGCFVADEAAANDQSGDELLTILVFCYFELPNILVFFPLLLHTLVFVISFKQKRKC